MNNLRRHIMMQQGGGGDKPTRYQIWYTTTDNSQITGENFASDTGELGGTINPVISQYLTDENTWIITFQNPVIATARDGAFRRNTKLQSVILPESLQIVGYRTFSQCTNLTSVSFGSLAKTIQISAFEVCTLLHEIALPDSIEEIGDSAFSSCKAIGNLTLPQNLMLIGNSAFSSCTNLVVTEIPANVTSIGGTAFRYSNNVRNVKILRTTSMIIATGALMFADSCVISVPNALLSQYQNDTNWNRYTLIGY